MKTILLVTVTKVEAQAVFDIFEQATGKKRKSKRVSEKTYYLLGAISDTDIAMVRTEMGAATPGGSLLTLHKAIEVIKPTAIIMVGIAFGTKPEKQKLGDVLVSQLIKAYEPEKEGRISIPRGVRVNASPALLDIARATELDWKGPNSHFGLILSGEKLVNSLEFRNRLIKLEPEAIGGEMEGNGLYLAANDAGVHWILVKGICDWADGKKKDKAQPVAAQNATRFVLSMIQHLEPNTRSDGLTTLLPEDAAKVDDLKINQNIRQEQDVRIPDIGKAEKSPPDVAISSLEMIVEIFDRDFIYPNECDEVSLSLRNLADTLSLVQPFLYLEFAFKRRILVLANQIDEFRKICRTGTLQADNERKNILNNLERLSQEFGDVKKSD